MNMENRRHMGGMRRRKVCQFCADKSIVIDYKDVERLQNFVTERGKILTAKRNGENSSAVCWSSGVLPKQSGPT